MAEDPRPPGSTPDVDDEPPPTADELAEAARLRDALEAADDAHPLAALALATRAAANPSDLAPGRAEALAAAAVAPRPGDATRVRRLRGAFASATATLALAAGTVLALRTPPEPAHLRAARSTEPLFVVPAGTDEAPRTSTARIDRIAVARSDDFRDNRFARWGVK